VDAGGNWTATIPTTSGSLTTEVVAEYISGAGGVNPVDKSVVVHGGVPVENGLKPFGAPATSRRLG